MRLTLVSVLAAMLLVLGAPVAGGVAAVGALVGAAVAAPSEPAPASGPVPGVPVSMAGLYQAAAAVCPGLPWTVLAAIGTVESDNGESTLPGVHSGRNPAGAEGPMQFEPVTFAQYDEPDPPGGAVPPSPYDPVDAVYAAARLLCANGAGTGGNGLRAAIFDYNHATTYVDKVLSVAAQLMSAGTMATTTVVSGADDEASSGAAVAVAFSLAQLGTPYRWGGETPGVGFDCSGLVQAAWDAAGVRLPRVAEDQFAAGPVLTPGTPLQPGDLVFFGPPGGGVTHVGMVTNPDGEMVDAPYTGAVVRIDRFPLAVGAAWGTDIYVGATRPGSS